ncbi:MAG: BatA domain-containing protein [Bryobacterales bacterium]|nr:BatA domain-containing protein [Bryobacterales bacterium]
MGLLSPWFLAGLGALALPVYLHLLQQHKTTPVPFSSLMFFERRTQSSIKHRRLKYLALLALRLLLLTLIALAFAQPFIQREVKVDPSEKRMMLVIDRSFSMRAGSRLADAQRAAQGLLDRRPATQPAQIAALGARLDVLTEPTTEKGNLQAAIASVQAGDEAGAYGELSRALRMSVTNDPRAIEAHLFTDTQQSALPAGFADLALPAGVTLAVHGVAPTQPVPNWTVETVSAPSMLWDPKKARVQATIAGFHTPAAKRSVSLVVNNAVTATKQIDVPAAGRATVEFQGLDIPYGASKCELRLDAADALAADDRVLFSVQRSDPKRVLLVHESRDPRSPIYFRAALTAAAEAAFTLDTMTAEQSAGADLSRYAFVALADAVPPAAFVEKAQRYVAGGGSLLVAAGTNATKQSKIPVLDLPVSEGQYYSRSGERFSVVGEADPAHPSLRRAGKWEGVKFFYAVKVEPQDARVVARLSDRTPLLLERKIGEGRALVFTSTFDNVANDFPLHPAFVAFIDQSARYLGAMEDRNAAVNVSGFVELRSAKEQAVSVEVIDPDGKRPLSLRESTQAQTFQLNRAGFFEVRRANGRHEMLAVNPDRRESDLSLIPAETVQLWTASGNQTSNAAGGGPASFTEEPAKKPLSFWWYFLLAAALATAAESVLASRYLGVQRE